MVIRMFEYDFAIALEEARKGKAPYRMKFPLSAVIYLRLSKKAKDLLSLEVEFPDGQTVTYKVPVINVQDYSLDDIFSKWLWLFIPFYIMRYQKQFEAMEADKSKRQAMLDELEKINAKLTESAKDANLFGAYTDLIHLSRQIADHLLKKQPKTKKEVRKIMGGKILELPSEKIAKKQRRKAELRDELKDELKDAKMAYLL